MRALIGQDANAKSFPVVKKAILKLIEVWSGHHACPLSGKIIILIEECNDCCEGGLSFQIFASRALIGPALSDTCSAANAGWPWKRTKDASALPVASNTRKEPAQSACGAILLCACSTRGPIWGTEMLQNIFAAPLKAHMVAFAKKRGPLSKIIEIHGVSWNSRTFLKAKHRNKLPLPSKASQIVP